MANEREGRSATKLVGLVLTAGWVYSCLFVVSAFNPVAAIEPPRVLDADWQIELVASEPDLVTPVHICFDAEGRLLVVECHTHFPPDDYDGPKVDRVYRFDDSDGDGELDRQRLFYEGGRATMGVAKLNDGWIAIASRSEVIRVRDSDDDGSADEREVLLTLKTAADYPHNGLAGIAVGPDSRLYVGQGENFGEPYELVANDASKQVGSGEGGNIFSCTLDGKDLDRFATGFWNPFGVYFDSAQRLWTVGNDPDASPPCRLLHVVPTGDYGFQFRFGRAGTHPLLAWNGELPGTLGMAAGTGEAPCAVIGQSDSLWVTSWGDNRIERFHLAPQGASWTSQLETLVQGDANFRPVGMAAAPDGSVYFTDWVDRSYPVHRKGRLWRMSRKSTVKTTVEELPQRTAEEEIALKLIRESSVGDRVAALASQDPFVRQAAIGGLVRTGQLSSVDKHRLIAPEQRYSLLTAWRWQELAAPAAVTVEQRRAWIEWGLNDDSEDVVLAAIRWASENNAKEHLTQIRMLLDRPRVSSRLFTASIAAIVFLETGSASRSARDPAIEKMLVEFASDVNRPAGLRAMAIRELSQETVHPDDKLLRSWIGADTDRELAFEVIRLLAARDSDTAFSMLAEMAGDDSLDEQTRADAIGSMARNAGMFSAVLNQAALPKSPVVIRQEAGRVLKRTWTNEDSKRPRHEDLQAWEKLVGNGGDALAGRRVFFRSTCVNCHAHSGRGATTGPDLTTLSGTTTSKRLLESILQPSKEIGPLYVPWQVLTVNGQVLTGLKLDRSGVGNSLRYQGADGMIFEVPLLDIEEQSPLAQSIMPTGLEESMSIAELRDLIAFLVGK